MWHTLIHGGSVYTKHDHTQAQANSAFSLLSPSKKTTQTHTLNKFHIHKFSCTLETQLESLGARFPGLLPLSVSPCSKSFFWLYHRITEFTSCIKYKKQTRGRDGETKGERGMRKESVVVKENNINVRNQIHSCSFRLLWQRGSGNLPVRGGAPPPTQTNKKKKKKSGQAPLVWAE